MTRITFTLERHGKNASLKKGNEMISSNDRYVPIVKSQITKHLRQLAEKQSRGLVEKPYDEKNPCDVIITVRPPSKRRMDPPNWYPTVKALLDGMTDAGVWTDDNNHVIKITAFQAGELSGIKDHYILELQIREHKDLELLND